MHFLDVGGLAKDGAQHIAVLAAIRVYDLRLRSCERVELQRLKLELEAARREASHG